MRHDGISEQLTITSWLTYKAPTQRFSNNLSTFSLIDTEQAARVSEAHLIISANTFPTCDWNLGYFEVIALWCVGALCQSHSTGGSHEHSWAVCCCFWFDCCSQNFKNSQQFNVLRLNSAKNHTTLWWYPVYGSPFWWSLHCRFGKIKKRLCIQQYLR